MVCGVVCGVVRGVVRGVRGVVLGVRGVVLGVRGVVLGVRGVVLGVRGALRDGALREAALSLTHIVRHNMVIVCAPAGLTPRLPQYALH